jgi:hypothetical protein
MILVPGPHLHIGTMDIARSRRRSSPRAIGGVGLPSSGPSVAVAIGYDVIAVGVAVSAHGTFFSMPRRMLVRLVVLETPHRSDPALDAAMVLLKTIIPKSAGAVQHRPPQSHADRSWIGAVAVRRHPIRQEAHGCRSQSQC